MKTTIELPDDLFLKVKVMAAERSTTLKDIIVQSLQMFTRNPSENDEKKRKAMVKRLLKAMQASNTEPMIPLTREEIYDR
jgi:predicted transcriptional regulator